MEKLVRDGSVAVIIAPDYGAGWYSWHDNEELLYSPSIVTWVVSKEFDKIKTYLELVYPDDYYSDLTDLTVAWIPLGTLFRVEQYDGAEYIVMQDQLEWLTA